MIEFLWPFAKTGTIRKLFIPFIGYLFSFWIYTNFVDEIRDHPELDYGTTLWITNLVVLCGFSVYFLKNEAK